MRRQPQISDAIQALKQKPALLVFPIKNKKEPDSLWSCFYPKTKMRWEWDDSGDNRVVQLWHLRAEIAKSKRIVYSKWFQNRASVFRKDLLPGLLRVLNESPQGFSLINPPMLSDRAREILQLLSENSPLSTKELKSGSGLRGSSNASTYERVMKELFSRFLIVGVGEIEDGAFPSLAIGATELYFDQEWETASALDYTEALARLKKHLGEDNLFLKQIPKLQKKYLEPQTKSRSSSKDRAVIAWGEL